MHGTDIAWSRVCFLQHVQVHVWQYTVSARSQLEYTFATNCGANMIFLIFFIFTMWPKAVGFQWVIIDDNMFDYILA